jgi:hypothetical protein
LLEVDPSSNVLVGSKSLVIFHPRQSDACVL